MNRNPNGAGLIGDSARNCLTNPPGGISRKFVTTTPLKLVHAFHQAKIALLNQVEKLESAVLILLGNGNHQAQIGFSQFVLGLSCLGFACHNHLMRSFDFQRRNVMFGFDLFQPTFRQGNVTF